MLPRVEEGQVWRNGSRVVTVRKVAFTRAILNPHPDGIPGQRASSVLLRWDGRWARPRGWVLVSAPGSGGTP